MIDIYIRPLRMGDHLIAYHWRNNPEVWKYTGSRPDIVVTEEIEAQWMERVLKQTNALRYGICIKDTDEYIGNVTITDIDGDKGEFHTHIGAVQYWGKGLATKAAKLMLNLAFSKGVNHIHLYVHKDNKAAVGVYEKCGFKIVGEEGGSYRMEIHNEG